MIGYYLVILWCVIQLLFIIAKLLGAKLSWEEVYMPMWLPITFGFILMVLAGFGFVCVWLFIHLLYLII